MTVLGSVSPSSQPLRPVQPAMGDITGGLASGLNRAQSAAVGLEEAQFAVTGEQNQAENLAFQRQLKLDRASAMAGFFGVQSQIEIDQAELAKSYQPGTHDYTERATAAAQKRLDEFNAGLRPELQEEFMPDIARYSAQLKTNAYTTQVTIEDANWKLGLAGVQKRAIDDIYTGNGTIEDWLPTVDAYLENSPLSANETRVLREQVLHDLETTDFTVQAQDELLNWETYPAADSSAFPPGMPAPVVGMLSYIAQIESGNRDNVINGGSTFSDMSDHPRSAPSGSSAAGAWQIIEGTWERAKEALHLTDFTRASQAKAAWYIAKTDYARRTGGRDLLVDLSSGDFATIAGVRKALAGEGNNTTWQALQNVSDEEFFAAVMGGKMAPPSVMTDPMYSTMTAQERTTALGMVQKAASEKMAAAAKAQSDRQTMLLDQMKKDIAAGQIDRNGLNQFISSPFVSQAQAAELTTLYDKTNANETALRAFSTAAQDPHGVYGETEKKGFDVYYRQEGPDRIAAKDEDYLHNQLFPLVMRSGVYPTSMVQDLTSAVMSRDPNMAAYGLRNLARLREQDPAGFDRAFGEQVTSDITEYMLGSRFTPETQLVGEIMQRREPGSKLSAQVVQQATTKYLADNPGSFTTEQIASDLGIEFDPATSDFVQMQAFSTQFYRLFSQEMLRYGDGDKARAAALQKIGAIWGSSNFGDENGYLMQYPPEKAGVPPIGGSYDYVDPYVREQAGIAEGEKFQLASDPQTLKEIDGGKPVSYGVMTEQVPGVFLPKIDLRRGRWKTGQAVRVTFYPTDLKAASVDTNLWFHQMQVLDSTSFGTPPGLYNIYPYTEQQKLLQAVFDDLYTKKPKMASDTRHIMQPGGTTPEERKRLYDLFNFSDTNDALKFLSRTYGNGLIERLPKPEGSKPIGFGGTEKELQRANIDGTVSSLLSQGGTLTQRIERLKEAQVRLNDPRIAREIRRLTDLWFLNGFMGDN